MSTEARPAAVRIATDREAFDEGLGLGLDNWVARYYAPLKVTVTFEDETETEYTFETPSVMATFLEYMDK